ncbi:hypothetical protein AIR33_22885 [Salmonella enterica]|nr:hypothetical protein [Salmonella enterica]
MRLTARRQLAGVPKAQDTARKRGGASGTEAASLPLTLRHGMEARQGGDGLPAPFTTARPDARCENGNGQKTENGRIRMD